MERMRLDKFLASYTSLSRKEAKHAIRRGEVSIEGRAATSETEKVSTEQNICLRGERVIVREHLYLMMNKPKGVLSATRDREERTVVELVTDAERKIFPVGRLDKDTEGFLLLTDDGELAHQLLSPTYHVPKTYYLEYEGELVDDAVRRVAEGIDIGEKRLTRAGILQLKEEGKAELTIEEGKYHQVKRMITALGGRVTYLKRLSMAGLELDREMKPGEYRELKEEEVSVLRDRANRKR